MYFVSALVKGARCRESHGASSSLSLASQSTDGFCVTVVVPLRVDRMSYLVFSAITASETGGLQLARHLTRSGAQSAGYRCHDAWSAPPEAQASRFGRRAEMISWGAYEALIPELKCWHSWLENFQASVISRAKCLRWCLTGRYAGGHVWIC
jgi:hypothetical protein